MKNVTVAELKQKMDHREDFTLLDIREPYEVVHASVNPHVHIPMDNLPLRYNELDKLLPVIVICHTGIRSVEVCHYLERFGFDVANLMGGIDAWSKEIDSAVPLY